MSRQDENLLFYCYYSQVYPDQERLIICFKIVRIQKYHAQKNSETTQKYKYIYMSP